ncbi:MAG: hypothetical protein ACE37H_16160 [Phycisphaeraceae bacterium]
MQDRDRLAKSTPNDDAFGRLRRSALVAGVFACAIALPACEEQPSTPSSLSAAPVEQAREPIDADAVPLFVVQTRLAMLIDRGRYEDATGLLSSLKLSSYVEEAEIAGPLGRPQFWAVQQDGVWIPYVRGLDAIKPDAAAQIREDAWVMPGTSDASDGEAERAWRAQATKAATMLNEMLYLAVDESDR